MRKIIAAATFGLVLGVAGASNPGDQSPETRAYFSFNFGGTHATPRNFHYGLRIDHDSRYLNGPAPALMQFDFTRAGLHAAQLNGMNVVRQQYTLRQAEEPATEEVPVEEAPAEEAPAEEAPAEEAPVEEAAAEGAEGAAEPGFFSKIGAWFGGLFGGGDEAATETAEGAEGATEEPAAETADAGETADGPFANYSLVDWGLLAMGAVGLGYAAGEVSNSSESDDPAQPTTGPAPTGPATPVGPTPVGPTPAGATPIGIPITGYFGKPELDAEFRERMGWLDGGTGHMGDLQQQDE